MISSHSKEGLAVAHRGDTHFKSIGYILWTLYGRASRVGVCVGVI